MQLFQQGQPAIERLASGSKRRIKKDLARPNLRTSPYVVADLFERLEGAGVLLRIDQAVSPTMYRGATISKIEVEMLRAIRNVVRKTS